MASYDYQYSTNARKFEIEDNTPKRSPKKVKSKKNNNGKTIKSKMYQDKVKKMESKVARTNFSIVMVIALGCILLLMYRSVKIRESFAGVQSLSKSVSLLEKENSQILVNIQNHLNLNDIEKNATSALGMQKLSSKQTVYINLDTKDYTELTKKSIVKEHNPGLMEKIFDRIKDWF